MDDAWVVGDGVLWMDGWNMPELPEVETVRRILLGLVGRRVVNVKVRRRGFVDGDDRHESLLVGMVIEDWLRHGKEMIWVGGRLGDGNNEKYSVAGEKDRGAAGHDGQEIQRRAVAIHLGMTGALRVMDEKNLMIRKHDHLLWYLDDGRAIAFHDPRRFGHVMTFSSVEEARKKRFGKLGPDALTIEAGKLAEALKKTKRRIKVVLLDQRVIAGVGNIYADEVLFGCGIHPCRRADRMSYKKIEELAESIRKLLRKAIDSGGSTVRDYVNSRGEPGKFQLMHQVYGRKHLPCTKCGKKLRSMVIAGRTSVYCTRCQPPHCFPHPPT